MPRPPVCSYGTQEAATVLLIQKGSCFVGEGSTATYQSDKAQHMQRPLPDLPSLAARHGQVVGSHSTG